MLRYLKQVKNKNNQLFKATDLWKGNTYYEKIQYNCCMYTTKTLHGRYF